MAIAYVFGEPGALLVKVGYTAAPENRLYELRRTISKAGEFLYEREISCEMVERQAHRLLRRKFWFFSEWFVCGPDVAKAAIRRAQRMRDRGERL